MIQSENHSAFICPAGMLLIDLLIKSPISLIGQDSRTSWLELYYRHAEISALLSSTMQITLAGARFGKRSRAHCKRWSLIDELSSGI